ncbi:MAG: hypothetical protein NTX61_12755 [Bacteroidetes bacterium]|nr:hypothetical protein [Bacteroidota bacterium]
MSSKGKKTKNNENIDSLVVFSFLRMQKKADIQWLIGKSGRDFSALEYSK